MGAAGDGCVPATALCEEKPVKEMRLEDGSDNAFLDLERNTSVVSEGVICAAVVFRLLLLAGLLLTAVSLSCRHVRKSVAMTSFMPVRFGAVQQTLPQVTYPEGFTVGGEEEYVAEVEAMKADDILRQIARRVELGQVGEVMADTPETEVERTEITLENLQAVLANGDWGGSQEASKREATEEPQEVVKEDEELEAGNKNSAGLLVAEVQPEAGEGNADSRPANLRGLLLQRKHPSFGNPVEPLSSEFLGQAHSGPSSSNFLSRWTADKAGETLADRPGSSIGGTIYVREFVPLVGQSGPLANGREVVQSRDVAGVLALEPEITDEESSHDVVVLKAIRQGSTSREELSSEASAQAKQEPMEATQVAGSASKESEWWRIGRIPGWMLAPGAEQADDAEEMPASVHFRSRKMGVGQ